MRFAHWFRSRGRLLFVERLSEAGAPPSPSQFSRASALLFGRLGCLFAMIAIRAEDFDTLTLVGRSLFAVCRRLSHSGRVVPGVMSRSTEAAEGGTRDEVSLDVEDVVNGGVDGDEALG